MNIEDFLQQVSDLREYKRGQAVKLSEAGLSRGEIAKALSVSEYGETCAGMAGVKPVNVW